MNAPTRISCVALALLGLTAIAGCASPSTGLIAKAPTTQPLNVGPKQASQLRQLLLIASDSIQALAAAGVVSSQDLAISNDAYGAAVAALNQYDADVAAGNQPGADLALAAAGGYLQQLGAAQVKGRQKKSRHVPASQPLAA